MTDYIKRGYAKNAICSSCANPCSLVEKATSPCVTIIELARIPSADVAPVRHGRWKKDYLCSTNGGMYSVIRCSECDFQFPMTVTNYCPKCGAKMDGEKDDD